MKEKKNLNFLCFFPAYSYFGCVEDTFARKKREKLDFFFVFSLLIRIFAHKQRIKLLKL